MTKVLTAIFILFVITVLSISYLRFCDRELLLVQMLPVLQIVAIRYNYTYNLL